MRIVTPQHGFTLTEMAVTVAVLAILAALAVPSFQSTIDKRRLIGAAEQLYGDLQYARSEAIKGDQRVGVYFSTGTTSWCYGMDDDTTSPCVCTATVTNCTVDTVEKVFKSDGFRGVSLAIPLGFGGAGPPDETGFEPRRGLPMRTINSLLAGGTISLSSTSGGINVVLSSRGRIKLCSPSSPPLSGYPACGPP
mgnify:CR=1 FL=1